MAHGVDQYASSLGHRTCYYANSKYVQRMHNVVCGMAQCDRLTITSQCSTEMAK